MKTLLCDCVLPLSGGTKFCVEGERFVPALPPFDEVRRLDGACVLPAFPDAHSHLLAYALSLLQPDGSALLSAEEFVAAAETFAARRGLPLHAPVTIKNARVLPEGAPFEGHPRPLHVQARSGHAGAFNAAARMGVSMGIRTRTMMDKSTRNLATMLAEGSGQGVMDCKRAETDYPEASPGAHKLMQELCQFQEQAEQTWRGFL